MDRATFDALTVVDDSTAAMALSAGTPFLFADTYAPATARQALGYEPLTLVSGVNSQQGQSVGTPDNNRVTYFIRKDQEKCCGTYGTMTTRHSASYGLDQVYPGPYPGKGRAAWTKVHVTLSD